ncbi:serologically defined colon cancer antigen 8 isoform X6 [Heterocephalus glaber]|uniref:Serologically defined colon cancer antigen 8 isoform X6 n=1 Tax=Heterocephalus glaber TaxID=10181 RepID=A0AAX6TK95_HETGA|nr:serologically defined colon cancer antigen 8 isoform X6 [Heterocephalus glaber]
MKRTCAEGLTHTLSQLPTAQACPLKTGWNNEQDPGKSRDRNQRALQFPAGSAPTPSRERASRSIHQLKCALREGAETVEEEALDPSGSINVGHEDTETAWHELQHSHAVNQLKALLRQQASKESEISPSRRRKISPSRSSEYEETNMPTVHNLVPIINDQSQYIHHLEAEVKFCKEELSGMKNRVQVVVLENERLQQELKSQIQEETMREQTLLDASGNMQNSWVATGENSRVGEKRPFPHDDGDIRKAAGEAEKWKLELERLKLTYEAKSEILESQLTFLRKDLAEYQKHCEDLKQQLKHKESLLATNISNRVGGLCLRCAQHEAVLSQTHNNAHIQTIERLTKERDDLMSALISVRSSLADGQQRETRAFEQVKEAVHMTEEANFEKTKALIQCEQLRNELERQTERLEKELSSQQEKRAFDKEMMKKEVAKARKDMESKMLILSQNIVQLEFQVEKVTREKISAINQLEEVQNQLTSQEMDVTKVCGELRFQLNKAEVEKDEAEKEHREYRVKTKRDLEIKDQEIEKLKVELSETKQHVEQEQQQAARAREECLKLTELLAECEHQLHLTRSEIALLSQEKMYTDNKLEKLQRRNNELEEQCVQHGKVHETMKERLRQLDKHSQATAQQLVQLLNRQNQLLLERQSLSEEVDRLRAQQPYVIIFKIIDIISLHQRTHRMELKNKREEQTRTAEGRRGLACVGRGSCLPPRSPLGEEAAQWRVGLQGCCHAPSFPQPRALPS